MNQMELVYNYTKENREGFNKGLLLYDDQNTIMEVLNSIRMCERDSVFKVKLVGHYIIEDPADIEEALQIYNNFIRKKSSRKNNSNSYEYIKLKDTDMILLVVRYMITAKGESKELRVPICIPRTMKKFYFRIDGNWYYSMHQVVDGSTYNNTNTSSKKSLVTFKTSSMPIRIYRENKMLKTYKNNKKNAIVYNTTVFSRPTPVMIYILAKFGLLQGLNFMGFSGCIRFHKEPIEDDDLYLFGVGSGFYISAPKMLYEKEPSLQSMIYTLAYAMNKNTKFEDIFSNDYWLKILGHQFSNKYNIEKGLEICVSLESLYDIYTKNTIRLPDDHKLNIYTILRWLCREFSNLMVKDNLDLRAKKIRKAAYISSIYSMKLTKGIHRISRQSRDIKVEDIEKALRINPMHIIKGITKTKLVAYYNGVNDMDAFTPLKYTVKGPSGIAENSSAAIADDNKMVHYTDIGNKDMDSSSNGDPGLSGMLAPYAQVTDDGYFDSDFVESHDWETEFSALMDAYNDLKGMEQTIQFKRFIDGDIDEEHFKLVQQGLTSIRQLSSKIFEIESSPEVFFEQPFYINK